MPDEETKELMDDYDLEEDEAEQVKEIMDEYGLDEDEADEAIAVMRDEGMFDVPDWELR